jgi:hypothetical protein
MRCLANLRDQIGQIDRFRLFAEAQSRLAGRQIEQVVN